MNIIFSAQPQQQPKFGALSTEQKKAKRDEILEFCVSQLPTVYSTLKAEVKLDNSGSSNSAAIAAGHVLQTAATLLASDLDLLG